MSLPTRRSHHESELPAVTDFNQTFRLYKILKLLKYATLVFHQSRLTLTQYLFSLAMIYTNVILIFHWSRLTSTQCLFVIGHDLHPRNSSFSLVTAYTYPFLVFSHHFADLISARCTCQQHPPGLLKVKLIYYKIHTVYFPHFCVQVLVVFLSVFLLLFAIVINLTLLVLT